MRTVCCLGVGALGFFAACGTSAVSSTLSSSGEWFSDVTDRAGLHFVHESGPTGSYFFPQIVGSGGALIDVDNDGRLDVYLVQNAPSQHAVNRLFHQEADGTFRDVTRGSGVDVFGNGMGVAVGDVDNDGWSDMLLTEFGRLRLFVNNHDGTFVDVTAAAGLQTTEWGTSASFVDYDRDGWLDLIVANYVKYYTRRCRYDREHENVTDYCGPNAFDGGVTRLYHNLGGQSAAHASTVRFEDVTAHAGLERKGAGLGVVAADVNGDHWPDIFVANDEMTNFLWINRRDGTFSEEGVSRGIALDGKGRAQSNMGIAIGDVNGDGLFDIFVTHITEELHNGWMQGPQGTFQDQTSAMGLARSKWRSTGWGAVFGDFDQDGAPDLAWVNGRVKMDTPDVNRNKAEGGFWKPYLDRNQVFANDGAGHFKDMSDVNRTFSEPPGMSRGLMMGDIDGDGALDLLVTNIDGPARLFRNVARGRGHWLKVRTILPEFGGRDAYGAEVTVRAGSREWKRTVNPGFSYLVSNAPDVHIGLGSVERIDDVRIVWPDGTGEQFPGGPVDRALVLKKGTGQPESK